MVGDRRLALILVAAGMAGCVPGCVHGPGTSARVEAQSLGVPAAALTRALEGVEALGYTVTAVDGQGSHFEAEHSGRSLASLFGSDSNCRVRVRTEPAVQAQTCRVLVDMDAHDAGSIAGCRKDAQAILKAAAGEAAPAPPRRPRENVPADAPPPRGTWGY